MLTIRLARAWKHKSPFFRIVLTESTKPSQSWYKDVLGFFDPINHKVEVDVEKAKQLVKNWVSLSERVAKILYNQSKDELFKKFYTESVRIRKPRNEEK